MAAILFRHARLAQAIERALQCGFVRSDELLAAGDMDGRRVWLRILGAVKALLQREVPGGERVH